MKVEYINPFLRATLETFVNMMNSPAKAGKMELRSSIEVEGSVCGFIELGGGVAGFVAISFPRVTAVRVSSKMVGEVVEMGPDVLDAVGEIANIVAGAAKKDLEAFKIQITLPKVISGVQKAIVPPSGIPLVAVPFDCAEGKFEVHICFKERSA
jgi:chemotaxis protein CheX